MDESHSTYATFPIIIVAHLGLAARIYPRPTRARPSNTPAMRRCVALERSGGSPPMTVMWLLAFGGMTAFKLTAPSTVRLRYPTLNSSSARAYLAVSTFLIPAFSAPIRSGSDSSTRSASSRASRFNASSRSGSAMRNIGSPL